MMTHREIAYLDRAALHGLAASLLTVAVLGASLLAVSVGCRLFPPPTPPTPTTTTTTTTTTSTTTTTLPPAATFANPAVPTGPGEHISHKTYSGTGHAGRVYAIKWPSVMYREHGARPDNSHVLLLHAAGGVRRLGWYQLDDEAGHARPGYALLASAGVPFDALTAGDLLVLRVAGRSVAMLRLWDATLPATVALNAAEAAAIDRGM
jgi:hypothetical protein